MSKAFPSNEAHDLVRRTLAEDRAHNDATTRAVVAPEDRTRVAAVAREPGVLAGWPLFALTFELLDSTVHVEAVAGEAAPFETGAVLGYVEGPTRAILSGERTALNLLQRLSGIATATRAYVAAIEGTNAVILDTRKTTPGLRALEKYAVRCGGGTNHRGDLQQMAMIKDNHRDAITRQGLTLAEGVERIRRRAPGIAVEVEIDTLTELDAALAAAPEWILLDNMAPADMAQAVARTNGRAKLEASGGITLSNVREAALSGVDAISIGALTHSSRALDIGLDAAG